MAGTKLHIVSCFALFALLVAPFAWRLTQVERVELPVDRIRALSWNASRFARPERHVVRVFLLDKDATIDTKALAALQPAASRVDFAASKVQLSDEQKRVVRGASTAQLLDDALLRVVPAPTSGFSVFLLCDDAAPAPATLTVGKHRHAWSRACSMGDAALSDALQRLALEHVFPIEATHTGRDTSRARVAVKYRLQFTLLKESADHEWTWQFERWQGRFLAPLLGKLGNIAQFTVEHQVVHYAQLAKEVHTAPSGEYHYVNADDLKHFKSTNDFLTSSVLEDREQILHFMAALPAPAHAPLFIKSENDARLATSFEIPGWGVVVLLNSDAVAASPNSEARELQRVMGQFVAQMRTLLGLPSFFQRERAATTQGVGIAFLPSPRDGIAQWELDVVMQSLLRRHVKASIETLQSIVQLVEDMTQMSVLNRVEQRITRALELMERILCQGDTQAQQCITLDADNAAVLLASARQAVEEADAAYYDHTMIRQLYFPQEQMLGVFAPLLAPLLMQFLAGWIREFKRWKSARRAQRARASESAQPATTQ